VEKGRNGLGNFLYCMTTKASRIQRKEDRKATEAEPKSNLSPTVTLRKRREKAVTEER